MIKLNDIKVNFGTFEALKGINLEVKEGEFFTLLGPSGCGKTTTLRSITGFITPASGTITIDNIDITNLEVEKRNIGMVFQNYAL
ncbi:MAG: ATP-binding cassette domain-containing protein, partial [Defluviitaleaceae bacterium]|nr:ATP-binding cassette domain-containing protein [Defluviitaleaceae bacterium]